MSEFRIETDPERVKILGDQKADENMDFRSHLKQLPMSDELLDVLVAQLTRPVMAAIDCRTCCRCCTELGPSLSVPEVGLAVEALGVSRAEFELLHVDRSVQARQNAESGMTPLRVPCPLLRDNECILGDARPEACHRYPHLLSPGFRSRLLGVVWNAPVCPIVYNVLELLKQSLKWKAPRPRP